MWEAIINYINSKAYRCEHEWEKIHETEVYLNEDSKMPHMIKHAYVCNKCMESKIIKV